MATKKYAFQAVDATREKILLRAGICGPTGSGKTLTALKLGSYIVTTLKTGPMFVIDSEHESARRYAWSERSKSGVKFKHVVMPDDDFSPEAYDAALTYCEQQGAGVVVIDSLSHLWAGINGVLEMVDQVTAASRTKNTFSEGWRTMTPVYARIIERIMQSSAHIIFTLRAKTEWVVQENDRGKKVPQKIGLAPVAREGLDYEADFFATMEQVDGKATLYVEKTRALDRPALAIGARHSEPDVPFFDEVVAWLDDGTPAATNPPPAQRPRSAILDVTSPKDRASAWRTAIGDAKLDVDLDALVRTAKHEEHDKLRTDVLKWIAIKRTRLAEQSTAPAPAQPGVPPPPSQARANGAAAPVDVATSAMFGDDDAPPGTGGPAGVFGDNDPSMDPEDFPR